MTVFLKAPISEVIRWKSRFSFSDINVLLIVHLYKKFECETSEDSKTYWQAKRKYMCHFVLVYTRWIVHQISAFNKKALVKIF